jgi:ArsR family transcriptional regulator
LPTCYVTAHSGKIDIFALMNKALDIKKIERISKALGDPYRLKIIDAIKNQDNRMQCGCIISMLNLAQSTISHHLKQLVDADLLIAEKDGRNISYQVNKEVFNEYIEFLTNFGV